MDQLFPLINKEENPIVKYQLVKKRMQIYLKVVFFYKYKLLNIPKKITKFEVTKSKLGFRNKYTKFTAINCPIIPIHLRVI